MTSNDPTWDAPAVAPEVWEAMEDVERLREWATPGRWQYWPEATLVSPVGPGPAIASLFDADGRMDDNGALIAALHNVWPEVSAHLRRLSERVVYLEQQERQRAVALDGLEEERIALQAALGDLLSACEHEPGVINDPAYDAARETWEASLTPADERRIRAGEQMMTERQVQRRQLLSAINTQIAAETVDRAALMDAMNHWDEAEWEVRRQSKEIDRLKADNQTLREALTEARSWVALVSDQEPRFRTNLSLLVEQIDAALVAEGGGDDDET